MVANLSRPSNDAPQVPTNTPEFRAQFLEHVIEKNKGITHADFVVGMQNKVIGFKCLGKPILLVRGVRKAVFTFWRCSTR